MLCPQKVTAELRTIKDALTPDATAGAPWPLPPKTLLPSALPNAVAFSQVCPG